VFSLPRPDRFRSKPIRCDVWYRLLRLLRHYHPEYQTHHHFSTPLLSTQLFISISIATRTLCNRIRNIENCNRLCSCCLLFQTSPILLRPAASSTSSTWRPRAKDVCICMYIYICVCVCSRLLFVLPMGVFPAPLLILYARCPFWATVTSAAPSLVVVPFGSSTRMWMWNSLD